MINSAAHYPISTILNHDHDTSYIVPKYQREYVWGKKHWEDLFDDIDSNPDGHFLGSIICINRSKDALQTSKLELVDGQQRLMTLSLFYAAIHSRFGKFPELDKETEYERYNLKHRLLIKKQMTLRVQPSYQNKNYQDYEAVVRSVEIPNPLERPTNLGNRRIFKAYRYFEDRLKELSIEDVRTLMDKVNRASLVKIEVNSHSDAFRLFGSLNNRGQILSAVDLIKNKLLDVLEKKQPNTIDQNFDKWNHFLEILTDNYAVHERYLRQYYNAFKFKEEIGVKNFTLATGSNIIQIYERLIDKDAQVIFTDLIEKARLYSQIIAPDDHSVTDDIATQFRDLERIGGVPAYVLLLYLLAERSESNLAAISKFLVKFFVRRNVTDSPPTRDLARNFISVIEELRKRPKDDALVLVQQEFQKRQWIAPDDVLRTKLEGDIYDENVDATRFVLCKIEQAHQTRERLTPLWERDSRGDYIWTVEHIFPQGENIPDTWVKMIADGDKVKAKERQEQYVHKLGNLTVTGYNSKLGNKSFQEKRDRKDAAGSYVGFKNGLYLNRELRDRDRWTVKDIEERTTALVGEALELFTL